MMELAGVSQSSWNGGCNIVIVGFCLFLKIIYLSVCV